jgi:hypothetical protein
MKALVTKLLYAPKGAFILLVFMLFQIGRATKDRLLAASHKRVNSRLTVANQRSC